METKELKITIPEGQEIDWQESAKQEKIVFKKKDNKPRSWEEYCKQQIDLKKISFYIESDWSEILIYDWKDFELDFEDFKCTKNLLPTKELAEAFLAMMQLMSLRQAWIGDWEPDWNGEVFYCIVIFHKKYTVENFSSSHHSLSFPTEEMARDFMNTFKDLLKIAKPLI